MSHVRSQIRFASLFCGCGGFDLGLKGAGMQPIAGFDACDTAIDHYRRNVCPNGEVKDLTSPLGELPKVDVVIAGPPCQGFSTVGKRNLGDQRNHLLPLAGKIAVSLKPKVILIENVWAAKAGGHARYWSELEATLREKKYSTHTLMCNAADLGLAQSRRRLLLIAWKGKKAHDFDAMLRQFKKPNARLDEVLSGVETLPDHEPRFLAPDSKDYRIASRIGPGQKLCNVRGGPRAVHTWNIPEVFGKTTAEECKLLEFIMRVRRQERRRDNGDADPVCLASIEAEFKGRTKRLVDSLLKKRYLRPVGEFLDLCHTFNGKYRRFQWDSIACAVDTRFGEPQLFLHPNEARPFTVREAARIQGFPDDYTFGSKPRDNFRLIGNAVPPMMGEFAAACAREALGS